MQQTTISKSPRVEVVDALRGFAVLAILLVHNVEHFIYPVYPDPATLPGWLNVLNDSIRTSRRREKTSVTASFGDYCC